LRRLSAIYGLRGVNLGRWSPRWASSHSAPFVVIHCDVNDARLSSGFWAEKAVAIVISRGGRGRTFLACSSLCGPQQ
jgi:hypothetical protein